MKIRTTITQTKITQHNNKIALKPLDSNNNMHNHDTIWLNPFKITRVVKAAKGNSVARRYHEYGELKELESRNK